MDKLEQFIRDNRDMFYTEEPNEGHEQRFETRLNRAARRNRIQLIYRVSRVAAVGLILIVSSIWVYNQVSQEHNRTIRLGEVNSELAEVEFYFTHSINKTTSQIKELQEPVPEEYKEAYLNEMEAMDSVYQKLQEDLGANPGEDRIIKAMIQYYQTKLDAAQRILNQLLQIQEFNNSKNEQYESVSL